MSIVKYLPMLILLFIFFFFKNIDEKVYKRHIQHCSGIHALDREWILKLKNDSTFSYSITTINTRAINKESSMFIKGKWTLFNDTLALAVDSMTKSTVKFLFINRKEKLFPINEKADTISGFIMNLDFLRRE